VYNTLGHGAVSNSAAGNDLVYGFNRGSFSITHDLGSTNGIKNVQVTYFFAPTGFVELAYGYMPDVTEMAKIYNGKNTLDRVIVSDVFYGVKMFGDQQYMAATIPMTTQADTITP